MTEMTNHDYEAAAVKSQTAQKAKAIQGAYYDM